MPEGEDRFSDLGRDERSRAERIGDELAERDRTHPEPDRGPPEVPRASNKYAWLVGIILLMGISVLLITTALPNRGEGLLGLKPGAHLPDFAAPNALGHLEGDANLCHSRPCPKGSGAVPACELKSKEVVNICELRRQPLVLTFVFDRGADCFPEVDRTERVMGKVRGVRFATVYFSRKDRAEIRSIVAHRGWRQPVAVDADGQLANRYSVGGCPTTLFAKAGGLVVTTKLGNLTEGQLRQEARRLVG
jgi:peroxiredoxin